MNLFEFIYNLESEKEEDLPVPDGYCPNCWGRQEYGGNFYKSVKAEGIDTNNLEKKKGWIQAYAEKHLSGINLRQEDSVLVCNNCHTKYEMTDDKLQKRN